MGGEKRISEDDNSGSYEFRTVEAQTCIKIVYSSDFSSGQAGTFEITMHRDMAQYKGTSSWDSFMCYLYGVILRKLELPNAAQVLQDAVNLNPLNWAAWLELANLIKNSEMASKTKY